MRTFSYNFPLHKTVLISSRYIFCSLIMIQFGKRGRGTNIVYRVYRVLTNIDYYGIGGRFAAHRRHLFTIKAR